MKGRIRKQMLAATLGVSLLQPVAFGVMGSLLLGAATGELRAKETLNIEAIARMAQAITVRVDGATQGSGVLVKREGNRYTVLTAWHVVSGQRLGEELAIITPDGKQHRLEQGSIQRLGQVDLAVLSFSSAMTYPLAQLGEARSVAMGNPIFVAGFPIASSAVPERLLRFLDGRVVANTTAAIPNGYRLLYSSGLLPTLPGMSGGPVLNSSAQLIGIHGQSEVEDQKLDQEGVFVKTGTNQAVPISYFISMYQPPALPPTPSPSTGHAVFGQEREKEKHGLPALIVNPRINKDQRKKPLHGDAYAPSTLRPPPASANDPICELRKSLGYKCQS